jgi:hypothetical protein
MREGELRRQAREWMGDDDTQVNVVVSNSTDQTRGKRDIESLGEKSASTSTSATTSHGVHTNG